MPSPIGHALAGMAAGWMIAAPVTGRRRAGVQAAVFALAATVPDLDLLGGTHRGPSHSLVAAVIAGAATWIAYALLWSRRPSPRGESGEGAPVRSALAVAAAYATHTLLDWLGSDSSDPIGIMALWPMSHDYYASDSHVFMSIWRRYWTPGFWTHNALAVAREVVILGPLAWLAWRKRQG
ncbi:MAG: metal-dependent hydrolase [Acidobacteriota bacterium]|nr:metal-dependent hydrolase [Acidobacteriota bacterium]